MNFDCVGTNEKGEMYMKFHTPFSFLERIQLLQRWILVHSYIYYELNDNIASDSRYDENAKQLAELRKKHPDDFKKSKYYEYFHDFCSDEDGVHCTSGFDILERVRKNDAGLYHRITRDAELALNTHRKGIKTSLSEVDDYYKKLKRELKKKEG